MPIPVAAGVDAVTAWQDAVGILRANGGELFNLITTEVAPFV